MVRPLPDFATQKFKRLNASGNRKNRVGHCGALPGGSTR